FGKPPDVVIEVVSNKKGGELARKLRDYVRIGARYYVIFDPQKAIQDEILGVYELHVRDYQLRADYLLPEVELSLTIWDGSYEGGRGPWLRWCDLNGILVRTGAEQADYERQRAEEERQRAENERQRAEEEHARAEKERQRANRLLAQLRAAGLEPDE
ncbi:MAG: Uma2 family endonuclease, partial [Caldilineaceae bacterium]|nr:Uma2 family endonuclease [Caldilineaceae bacterium]